MSKALKNKIKLNNVVDVVADYGADPTGVADSTTAIQNAYASARIVQLPAGTYKITSTLLIPTDVTLQGNGIGATNIVISANVVGIRLVGGYVRLKDFTLSKSGTHTANGIDVGDTVNDGGRSTIESVYVTGMGNDGIQVRKGNLGTIRDVACVSNGRDGINFTIETPDNNAWTFDGYNDLRGNVRDGLNFAMGSSASDAYAPKSMFVLSAVCQSNGRYGVYSGTRSNIINVYCESNTTADVYLDTYAYGNKLSTVQAGTVTDNGTGNMVDFFNVNAAYNRGFTSKVLLSGVANKGLRIGNDDGASGYLDFQKTAANTFEYRGGGSSGTFNLNLKNNAAPTAYMMLNVGGNVLPDTDNTFNVGNASFRWSTIYAATGAINTSDARQKQQGRFLSDAEKAVALKIKSGLKAFKFNDAVEKKGDAARWHFGVYAQEVADAFKSEGLNPESYALFCYDEWEATEDKPAGSRYGIRYEELLAFIISAL